MNMVAWEHPEENFHFGSDESSSTGDRLRFWKNRARRPRKGESNLNPTSQVQSQLHIEAKEAGHIMPPTLP